MDSVVPCFLREENANACSGQQSPLSQSSREPSLPRLVWLRSVPAGPKGQSIPTGSWSPSAPDRVMAVTAVTCRLGQPSCPDLACEHPGSLGCWRLPLLPELDQILARVLSDRFSLPASPTAA